MCKKGKETMDIKLDWNEYFISNDDEVPVDYTITISGQYIADKDEKVDHARIVNMIYNDRYSQNEALSNGDFTMSISNEYVKEKGKQ